MWNYWATRSVPSIWDALFALEVGGEWRGRVPPHRHLFRCLRCVFGTVCWNVWYEEEPNKSIELLFIPPTYGVDFATLFQVGKIPPHPPPSPSLVEVTL